MRIATEPYLDWYEDLPEEIQKDVSHFLVYIWPEHPLGEHLHADDLHLKFPQWIRNASGNKFKAVGTALALIKMTEFVFINQRGSHEDWDITWQRIEEMRKSLIESGELDFAKKVEATMLEMPDRSARWIAAANAWNKVRLGLLSDDALHSCLQRRAD